MRKYRSTYLKRENNPYDFKGENRKLFEWIKPIQESALKCLVSCGILDKEKFEAGRVCVADENKYAYDERFHRGVNIIRGQNSSGVSFWNSTTS